MYNYWKTLETVEIIQGSGKGEGGKFSLDLHTESHRKNLTKQN